MSLRLRNRRLETDISMKHIPIFLAATLALTAATAPAFAQNAPANWKTQTRENGARTFTPPNLKAGELYSITVYDAALLGGKTLTDWLRGFGGAVGTQTGSLAEPMHITAGNDARTATASGVYVGPNGTALGALFSVISLDGQSVVATRTLYSDAKLVTRYKDANEAVLQSLVKDLNDAATTDWAALPADVAAEIKRGGALAPGIYAGDVFKNGAARQSYRVTIYANGEYRITDKKGADLKSGQGTYSLNRNNGRLSIDRLMGLGNNTGPAAYDYCVYGRDAAGKAVIVGGNTILNERTVLIYAGAVGTRPAPSIEKARAVAAAAEAQRFKWVTAPGKGVQPAQIAALVNNYIVRFDGMSSSITNDSYLLLRDGTIYNQLPVPPDELDAAQSRQKEPKNWGKWRAKGAGYEVSWNGKPYEKLPGEKVLPAVSGTKLSGRFGAVRSSSFGFGGSYAFWGATFDTKGRFRKDGRGGSSTNTVGIEGMPTVTTGYDESGSSVVGQSDGVGISSIKKKNPNGGNEGDYSTNGYEMTLRFDNGTIVRMPFFFRGADRKQILFEGSILDSSIDD